MVTRRDYTAEGIEAARSVLIELVHLLGEYKDDIVFIGGFRAVSTSMLPTNTFILNHPPLFSHFRLSDSDPKKL